MKKRYLIIILAALILAAGGYFIYTNVYTKPVQLASKYRTAVAARADVERITAASGKVSAKNSVSLGLARSQTVESVLVHKGDLVAAGAVLIVYDNEADRRELTRQIAETKLSLQNAELTLDGLELAEGTNGARYKQQANVVELTKIELERVEDELSKLTYQTKSPINGSVAEISAKEGGIAAKGTALVRLDDLSELVVTVKVSEYDAKDIAVSQRVYATAAGETAAVRLGTVRKISALAEKKETSSDDEVFVEVEISLDDGGAGLRPGYSAEAGIIVAAARNVISIPSQAIRYEDDGTAYVYALADNKAEKRRVVAGLFGNSSVEIAEGLAEGDSVLLDY